MKQFWVLLLLGMVSCTIPTGKKATITGVADNIGETRLDVLYYTDFLVNNEVQTTVPVDHSGAFKASLSLDRGEFVYVRTARRNIQLFVLPEAKVQIRFDASDPDVRTFVEGHLAGESIFLADYHHDVERNLGRALIINRMSDMQADQFMIYIDSVFEVKYRYLNDYPLLPELDDEFVHIMRTNIMFEKYQLLLEYPMYYAYFNQLSEAPEMPQGYYDFLADANQKSQSEGPYRLRSRSYLSFLTAYLNYLMDQSDELSASDSYFRQQFDFVKTNFTSDSRDYLLSQATISALHFDQFDASSQMYEEFLQIVSRGHLRDIVVEEFKAIQRLAPGNPAPDFAMHDINGHMVSLRDFRGKVVYLDFWASWCGPCLREIPHARELKRKMASNEDLIFMYVSIDTDEDAWRRTVENYGIQGVHMNVPGTRQGAPLLYNVKGVPTYYIIGRDGKIFDNRPPRPSNPQIIERLMEALLE